MKYFIDTEFNEDFHKPLFGKRRHFIDLISIGIVDESGHEYYAVSKDFDLKAVWNKYDLNYGSGDQRNLPPKKVYWLRENVLKPIFKELHNRFVHEEDYKGSVNMKFTCDNLKYLILKYGKSNKQVATEIMLFVWADTWSEWMGSSDEFFERGKKYGWDTEPIEFYGYYADYDWVLFCSLFGKMIDLPHDFPMYCRDLKQMLDEKVVYHSNGVRNALANGAYPIPEHELKPANKYFSELLGDYKNSPEYPKQTNEHNALTDAKWNKELFDFINNIK